MRIFALADKVMCTSWFPKAYIDATGRGNATFTGDENMFELDEIEVYLIDKTMSWGQNLKLNKFGYTEIYHSKKSIFIIPIHL